MIMVIGGRCQGKSSFAREHFESGYRKIKNRERRGNPERPSGKFKDRSLEQMEKQPPGKSFLPLHGAGIFICWCGGY